MPLKPSFFRTMFSLIFLQVFLNIPVHTQEGVKPNRNYSLPCKQVAIDLLERLYLLGEDNTVRHLTLDFKEKFRYANKRTGDITHLNVSNPIKILLFSRDFGKIIILDNTLAEVAEINLFEFGFTEVSAAGVSNDDQYWIFDPLRFRLIKINEAGNILYESSNINDFGIANPSIRQITESGNHVILLDENRGFLVFDNYGQYIRTIASPQANSFQIDGQNIVFFNGAQLVVQLLHSFDQEVLYSVSENEISGIKDVLLLKDGYLLIYDDGLTKVKRRP